MKPNILGKQWEFHSLWNAAMDSLPQRPLQKRDYIWASELHRPFIDRYLKMHAVKYTNPPNARSLRKFCSGHIWEWIISMILTMVGVMKEKQLRGEVTLPGCLRVSGKMDFIAGGDVDWEKAKAEIANIQKLFAIAIDDMPPFILHALTTILPAMEKSFSGKLKEVVVEAKSVSSFISDKLEKTKQPLVHNAIQLYHYILANPKQIDEGKLLYICKDDNIMHEFTITNNKGATSFYRKDVKTMTDIYNASNHKNPMKTRPDAEPEVQYDPDMYRFSINRMGVEWSPYLTLIYGYETPEAFRNKWVKEVASWNRTFKRCVRGDKMTDLNKKVIREATALFPEWDKYVQKARAEGAFLTTEVEEEE